MKTQAPGKVFTLPAAEGFLDRLARGLLSRHSDDPAGLASTLLLLPNRRTQRALVEAFLKVSEGRPLVLPRMQPLGDIDADELLFNEELASVGALDLPPVTPPLQRQTILARLLMKWRAVPLPAALRLADELAQFLDEATTEELALERLTTLERDDFAAHWQTTLSFLQIATKTWPQIEAAGGTLSPATRRQRLLTLQAEAWRRTPPSHPVIAAGSTGSIPATARLLAVIAELPQGEVILPDLDLVSDSDSWEAMARDATHPQHGLAQLLTRLKIKRSAVRPWCDSPVDRPRSFFIRALFLPASVSERWRSLGDSRAAPKELATCVENLERHDCANEMAEADLIALALRQAAEMPAMTAALVTPDRALARRVAAALKRWDLLVDDSAGQPLASTPPAVYLRLLADAFAAQAAPLSLLAALQHPLAAAGEAPGAFRQRLRQLEIAVLRGPAPAPGLPGIAAALARAGADELLAWFAKLQEQLEPFFALAREQSITLAQVSQAHLAAAETLAASAESGEARLWSGEAGEALASFAQELQDLAEIEPFAPADYPAVLDALLVGRAVRARYGQHPRLFIWSPQEARLQRPDLVILGGLNEGTWPALPKPDPWLSRPMRQKLGLPSPERRIGQAAHDVASLLAAPRVILTRSLKREGAPTVPARWLLRLDAVLRALALSLPPTALDAAWASQLDDPGHPPRHSAAPEPRPPVAQRPDRLSISDIGTLMVDPYEVYAKRVLKLQPLPPLEETADAAIRGSYLHRVLELFVALFPGQLPADGEAVLLNLGNEVLADFPISPMQAALWRPQLRRLLSWFFNSFEQTRRPALQQVLGEVAGDLVVGPAHYRVRLRGKADRIERRHDGTLAILDYKTGTPPKTKDVENGLAPQLALEALMAERGAFKKLRAAPVASLAFLRLKGTGEGELQELGQSANAKGVEELIRDADQGLERLLAEYGRQETAYLSRPRPGEGRSFGDYDHLARRGEWAPEDEG